MIVVGRGVVWQGGVRCGKVRRGMKIMVKVGWGAVRWGLVRFGLVGLGEVR